MFLYYFGIFLLLLAVWAVVIYVLFMTVQTRRQREWLSKQKIVTLLLKVPKNNEKTALSAEQMFASLHGIYRNKWQRFLEGSLQEHISFEIVSSSKYIKFYVTAPESLVDFLEGQMYAQYPTLLIEKIDDYTNEYDYSSRSFASCEIGLERDESYPIRTFDTFEVDPLAGVTAVLSKLGDTNNQIWVQLLMRPTDNKWQKRALVQVKKIRGEYKGIGLGAIFGLFTTLIRHLLTSGTASDDSKDVKRELSGPEEEAIKAIEEKTVKLGFETKIRVVCFADDINDAKNKINSVVGTFKQFSSTNINGFKIKKITINNKNDIESYKKRSFWGKGYVLNVKELASIYHLPSIAVATPAIVWSTAKTAEPPSNLPTTLNSSKEDLTVFGQVNFRGLEQKFGLKLADRSYHTYIVGKTGMGKTSLLQNMVIDDIQEGRGVAVVDPHGDFVDTVMEYIPKHRINDVILFDPGDKNNPVAFNLLEHVEDDYKSIVASGLVGVFKKLFAESWGPRLEHILRYTFLALLDYPGSTFLSVPRLLTDKFYRSEVLTKVKDPVVSDFWKTEFEGYPDKIRQESVMPIQNKVGQFLASSIVRNIIGQPVTSMNLREIMDNKKIFLVKVSKGIVGEDNSALLGATMITKIQLAAMSRQDIPKSERVPFNLYVDEFQNFATESFAAILSEARKYNLNLHVANQYIAQMEDSVREAIFGNVGTLISFRVGAGDAEHLAKEFAPVFTAEDLTNIERYQIYLRMTIDGISSAPFSATTLPLPRNKTGNIEKILKVSRERYSTERSFVEKKLNEWAEDLNKVKEEGETREKIEIGNRKGRKPFFGGDSDMPRVPDEDQKKKQSQLIDKLKKFQETKNPVKTEVAKEIANKPIAASTEKDSSKKEVSKVPIVNKNSDHKPYVKPIKKVRTGIVNKVVKDEESVKKAAYVKEKLAKLNQIRNANANPNTAEKSKIVTKPESKKTKSAFDDIGEITINTDGDIVED